MIDYDDADDVAFASLLTSGGAMVLLVIVALILFWVAFENEQKCIQKSCPNGQVPKLMENSCLCVTEAN